MILKELLRYKELSLSFFLVLERDQQIADAREEIVKLERELREQIDRDKSFQTPKVFMMFK